MRVKAKGIAAYLRLDAKTAGCIVEDISAGGLFIRTDRVVAVGTSIALDLVDSEAKKAVKLSGTVVGIITKEAAERREVPQGLRIRFERQPGATQAYLQRLLTRLGAPQEGAPVFYAVTSQPPRPRVATESVRGGGLPVLRREAPSLASTPPRRTDGSVGPPVLRPSGDASVTNLAPPEAGEDASPPLGDAEPNGTETAMESRDDLGADEELPPAPDARTVMADIAAYRAQLEQEGSDEGDVDALRARVAELEAAVTERDERIAELEAQLFELQGGSAGPGGEEGEADPVDDATPVPEKPRRR